MPQVVFVLSLFDGAIDQHVPDLDHIYQTKGAARKARLVLFKAAKESGVIFDWDHWWCVSYLTRPWGCSTSPGVRTYPPDPKSQCGIIIEECIVND